MQQPRTTPDETLTEAWDLLLSHRGIDFETAEALQQRLEREEYKDGPALRVWLDSVDIEPGHSIPGSINHGLERSGHVGLLLTPAYFDSESGWTDAEWCAALFADPAGRSGRVIPILVEDCPYIPPLLRHLNMIDLRGPSEAREFARLVRTLRGEKPRAQLVAGQTIRPDGRLDAGTIEAERSVVTGLADVVDENVLCNLLPMYPPTTLWFAPINPSLARGDGLRSTFPSRRELLNLIGEDRKGRGLKPFSPVFLIHGNEVVTFHQLNKEDSPLASVIDERRVRSASLAEWIAEDVPRLRLVTALLNLAVQRHLARRMLTYDFKKRRYFFPPSDGTENKIKWRKRGRPRTVARRLVDDGGRPTGWRHTAAKLPVIHLGGYWFIQVRPTVVFTTDGTIHGIQKGSTVGPMATAWLARERNRNMAYHTYFWGYVLGQGATPIRIRAGEGSFFVDPEPLEIRLPCGIIGDQVDLAAELEQAEDPDEGLELEVWDSSQDIEDQVDETSA